MKLNKLLCFISFLFCCSVFGQQYPFIQFDTKDGLAQSQVRAIAQDENGYIWFGTQGGLSRYDGYEFVNFSTEDGLSSNQINCMLQGSKYFWIGSTGSLSVLMGNKFSIVPLPEQYANSRIFDMSEDGDGNLWIALAGDGVLKFDGDKFKHFGLDEGLSNTYIRAIEVDSQDRVWVGTRYGLAIIENNSVDTTLFSEVIDRASISQILHISPSKTVFTSFGRGVFIVEKDSISHLTTAEGLQSNHIRGVTMMASGELWFGAKDGLSSFDGNQFTIFREADGLQYSNIKSLIVDREGNLWLGTDGQGVLLQAGQSFTRFNTNDGLHSDLILSICKYGNDQLLFGSYENGIAFYDGQSFQPYIYNDSLPNETIWTIYADTDSTIWAGTSSGLFREENGTISLLNEENGLAGNRVTAFTKVEDGYWVGADNGFSKIDRQGELVKTYNEESGFEGKRIRSIISDGVKTWIGAENGLYILENERISKYVVDPEEQSAIYCLSVDQNNQVWIGTSNGLFNTDQDEIEISEIEISTEFSAKNINFLETLKDSTLLIGTNNGLFRLGLGFEKTKTATDVKHYTYYEGLTSSETNQNSAFIQNNSVWFGTTSGVVRFEPETNIFRTKIPPVLNLTDIQLFLNDADWEKYTDSIAPSSGIPINPVLPFNQNYITFNFSGISLSNPEKVKYLYILEGADDTWLGPTKNRAITYAYLPHGDYTFYLEAFSEDAPLNISKTRFDFTITPPFYLTVWFFVLSAIIVLAILYGIYINQVKKEEAKRANLQLKFQSRLMELESQSLNSNMNRHFIFNSLNSIQYYINMQDRKSANRYLTSFAKLIRKNLDSSQQNETTLKDELERLELYLTLEQMRFQGRFDYDITISNSVNIEDVKIPSMMLQPFLENSIWHGILPNDEHGNLHVAIAECSTGIEIKISDNGIGVDTSKKLKSGSENGHISQGMDITQNRMQLYRNMTGLNYEIKGPSEIRSIDNTQTLGTLVTINLPNKIMAG